MINLEAPIANALRRIMIAEVIQLIKQIPTMAIHKV